MTIGPVSPVLSAYWHFYAALPLVLPSSFLGDLPRAIPPSMRVPFRASVAAYFVAVGWWALDGFNTEFSSAADRRRYGCR